MEYMCREMGCDAMGVDIEAAPDNPRLFRASVESLPFEDGSFDALLCECSFSLFGESERCLREFARVLKKGAALVMSDIYSRGAGGAFFNGEIRRLYTKEELMRLLEQNGFSRPSFEDHIAEMKTMMGQMIMDGGADSFYKKMGGCAAAFKAARCSYYLVTARKGDEDE